MYLADQKEVDAISKVILSKKYFRYQGKDVQTECSTFEKEFSEKMEVQHSVFLSSGTNALVAALVAAKIGPGDEVIIPAFTFFATAAAVIQVGAIPVVVNIDETLTIDIKEVESSLTSKTKAVIPVHMDGLACDMDSLKNLCQKRSLVLIEDVAQAVGGSFKGSRLGSIGDFGCYSFNVDKIISCGEGGALITNNEGYWKRAFLAHDTCCQFGDTMKDKFSPEEAFIGYSMRMSEINAAMIRIQLKRLDEILEGLRLRKNIWTEIFKEHSNFFLPRGHCEEGDCGTSFHFTVENPEEAQKWGQILRKNGVAAAQTSARPAHAVWQWSSLLNQQKTINSECNPFKFSDKKHVYPTPFYIKTLETLVSTIKVFIDFDLSPDETRRLALKVVKGFE